MAVLGVDGCRGGWVAALLRVDGTVRWTFAADAEAVLSAASTAGAHAVGIDIPIGLVEHGWRGCDTAARQRLGAASSRVFMTPPRPVLDSVDWPGALRACKEATGGKGLSKQAWNLLPKVAEVDGALRARPRDFVVEVHPELSFAALSGRVLDSKKTARGAGQRLDALQDVCHVAQAMAAAPVGVPVDDALDALAAAWSARRWARGQAEVLASDPPTDRYGLPMRIVV